MTDELAATLHRTLAALPFQTVFITAVVATVLSLTFWRFAIDIVAWAYFFQGLYLAWVVRPTLSAGR